MARRSPWGSVRRLASGRYQARYRLHGQEFVAPGTFRTKRDADAFLAHVRADVERGTWVNPEAGRITLTEYAWRWLEERPGLRPRTRELYESELRLHILPALGQLELVNLTTSRVRTWHAQMLKAARPGATTVAKCYRLLRAVLGTALEDELIVKNPCVLKGAGVEHSPERPVATIEQVYAWPTRSNRATELLFSWPRSRASDSGSCRRSPGAGSTCCTPGSRVSSRCCTLVTAACWWGPEERRPCAVGHPRRSLAPSAAGVPKDAAAQPFGLWSPPRVLDQSPSGSRAF